MADPDSPEARRTQRDRLSAGSPMLWLILALAAAALFSAVMLALHLLHAY
jgi:hypothetical protein